MLAFSLSYFLNLLNLSKLILDLNVIFILVGFQNFDPVVSHLQAVLGIDQTLYGSKI
jgi:hypothetical protein